MPFGGLAAQATLVHAGAFLTSAVEAVAAHVLRAGALKILVGDRFPLVAELLDGLVEETILVWQPGTRNQRQSEAIRGHHLDGLVE